MGKCVKRVFLCMASAALIWCAGLVSGRQLPCMIDGRADISVQACMPCRIREMLPGLLDLEAASAYLRQELPGIRKTAVRILQTAEVNADSVLSFPDDICRIFAGLEKGVSAVGKYLLYRVNNALFFGLFL